ncbi:MAG: sodium-dependent transporter, partial [Bdellovibrio sp.]
MKQNKWGTRFGFYLAAMGSAFGLGSLWRFPYIVAENGGGAFVLLYAALVFVVGIPLLIAELMLGKSTRRSVLKALLLMREGGPFTKPFPQNALLSFLYKSIPWAGRLSLFVNISVLSYYAVICGWVLFFLIHFLLSYMGVQSLDAFHSLSFLLSHGLLQALLAGLHILLVSFIVGKDVENGIEKWIGYIMPVFGVLLFVLIHKSLTVGDHMSALRFLFYPDFSKLKLSSLAQAIGHVFFALSLGFGTIVTFGSYLNDRTYVPLASVRVATLDSLISILAGLLVFPLVFSITKDILGPTLMFKTVPLFFSQIEGGVLLGIGFFLCMYLAALSASVGLFETVVANLRETYLEKRLHGVLFTGIGCFLLSWFPAFSSSYLKNWQWRGKGLLEVLDDILINWTLPLVALAISFIVFGRLSDEVKKKEFFKEPQKASRLLFKHWIFALKWIAPTIIIFALVLQLIDIL